MNLREIEAIVLRIQGEASEEQIDRSYEELWYLVQKQREEIERLKANRKMVSSP